MFRIRANENAGSAGVSALQKNWNEVISVSGDTATASCYLLVVRKMANGELPDRPAATTTSW